MWNSNNKKEDSIVIVYDDNCKSYANHLIQLIGIKNAKDTEKAGVKDESIKAVMWDTKKYRDTEVALTSNMKVVWIGRSKNTKLFNENAVKRYSKYGIEYGWLGSRAVITVDNKDLSDKDYEKFIIEAQMTAKEFELKTKSSGNRVSDGVTVAAIFGSTIFTPLNSVIIWNSLLLKYTLKALKSKKLRDEIKKQRYNFAVLKFYHEHLKEFVEG